MGRTGRDVSGRRSDAETAWGCMVALFRSDEHRDTLADAARRIGLTIASMRALLVLTPDRAMPMRALADELQCDASNVTQLVDVLETSGYVERVPKPTDRRVKLLRVTAVGARARADVIDRLHEPPAPIRALGRRDQAELARILAKALSSADPPLAAHHI